MLPSLQPQSPKRSARASDPPVTLSRTLELSRDFGPIDYADRSKRHRRAVTKRSSVAAFALWFLLFGLAAKSAGPATTSTSFSVSAVVQASCQASPTGTIFRTYAAALENAASSVSVSCTHPTPYSISLSTDATTAPDVPVLQLAALNLAAPRLVRPSNLRRTLNKPQSTAGNASELLSILETDPRFTIDRSSAYPGMVTVIITY